LNDIIEQSKSKGYNKLKKRVVYNIENKSVKDILSEGIMEFTSEQYQEITTGIYEGLSDEEIKTYIKYSTAEEMRNKRMLLTALKNRERTGGGV